MPARLNLRRPSTAVNAVLVVALVAGGIWAYETISGPDTGQAANASVRTVAVRQGTVTKTVTADGSVASATTASASFVTGGTVTSIAAHVGQVVKKGQVLAKVDPAPSERSLDAARADLDAANDSLTRAKAAGSDTSTAENSVEQAQLAVDQAQAAVDGCTLKAPMAGTVTAVNGTIGSSSSGTGSSSSSTSSSSSRSGTSGTGSTGGGSTSGGSTGSSSSSSSSSSTSSGFIEIDDLTKLEVTAAFAEADATKLKEKQAATVTWNALSSTSEPAKVSAIDPSATTSNNVVTYGVTLTLDKIPAGAKVGQTVSVAVTTGTVDNALMVSSAAVTSVGTRHTVTVVANGQQQLTPVQVGLIGDNDTQITSGVQEGQLLLINTAAAGTGSNGGGFGGAGGLGGAGFGGAATGRGAGLAGTGGTRTGGGR
jgi:macrolide-specific efflux system membrane fusion protein